MGTLCCLPSQPNVRVRLVSERAAAQMVNHYLCCLTSQPNVRVCSGSDGNHTTCAVCVRLFPSVLMVSERSAAHMLLITPYVLSDGTATVQVRSCPEGLGPSWAVCVRHPGY
jgi:hypothetical protein